MKTTKYLIICLCILPLLFFSCNKDDDAIENPTSGSTENVANSSDSEVVTDIETLVNNDATLATDFVTNSQTVNLSNAITIVFSETDGITINNPFENNGVTITQDNGNVTIRSTVTSTEVNYILSGKTQNGSVKIYSDYKFGLILNGVSLIAADRPAINIQSGKKVSVTLVDGTSNRLVDGSSYVTNGEEDMKAAFFSEGQLIFSGKGSLLVYGNNKHAICSDDYIQIKEGTIKVAKSVSDGIHTNDYVQIDGGALSIFAASDGIECEKGYIQVTAGTISISTSGDGSKGFKTSGDLTLAGGDIIINTSGNAYYNTSDSDIKSPAGIKCDGNLVISGDCAISIKSTGKAGKGINVDGTLVFNGGTTRIITSGSIFKYGKEDASAKAIKSDGNLTVNDGIIVVKTSTENAEGMESKSTLTINGGNIHIEAYDDCINASKHIEITGGTIYCYSATNDGIDSNGTLSVSGGLIVSIGAAQPEDGFDCDNNTFKITGGTLIGLGGSTSKPTANVCTQRSLIYSTSLSLNNIIHIESSAGETLTLQLPRSYSQGTLLFSSPNLAANTSYTIYQGGNVSGGNSFHGFFTDATYTQGTASTTFTTSSMVTTVGTTSSGPGGGPGGRP